MTSGARDEGEDLALPPGQRVQAGGGGGGRGRRGREAQHAGDEAGGRARRQQGLAGRHGGPGPPRKAPPQNGARIAASSRAVSSGQIISARPTVSSTVRSAGR